MTRTEGLLAIKSSNVSSLRWMTSLGTSLHSSSLGGGVEGAGLKWNNKITLLYCSFKTQNRVWLPRRNTAFTLLTFSSTLQENLCHVFLNNDTFLHHLWKSHINDRKGVKSRLNYANKNSIICTEFPTFNARFKQTLLSLGTHWHVHIVPKVSGHLISTVI